MSYLQESQELLKRTMKKRREILDKYDLKEKNGLDGGPYAVELKELDREVSEEIKQLRKKYPRWREEVLPTNIV